MEVFIEGERRGNRGRRRGGRLFPAPWPNGRARGARRRARGRGFLAAAVGKGKGEEGEGGPVGPTGQREEAVGA
jgi:hypothetical protein